VNVSGVTSTGEDIVIGDNGFVTWDSGGLITQFGSADLTLGDNDQIFVGDGDNIVVGGFGADTITTGVNEDLILGDNGVFTYGVDAGGQAVLIDAHTTDTTAATGGDDVIESGGGAGANIVLAGMGADQVNQSGVTSTGEDVVIGDNGFVTWHEGTGLISGFGSTEPAEGGNDLIDVGDGANIVVGGFGADTITTGVDEDLILGDNGVFEYTSSTGNVVAYTGGATQITVETADLNAALAQLGVATLNDLVGMTLEVSLAANDTAEGQPVQITAVGAGAAGETVLTLSAAFALGATGTAADILEYLIYSSTATAGDAVLTSATTTDTTNATGGDDVIEGGGGAGDNIVLAGVGADQVNVSGVTSTGEDIVIGDNGFVTWDSGGLITQFGSADPALGGDDTIDVGDGANIVVGGFGSDTVTTGAGADIVLGDDGLVDYVSADGDSSDIDLVTSTSTTAFGGADTITTGDGSDIVIGGRADDAIDAGEGDNVVVGDSGQITADDVDAPQLPGLPITLGLIESTQLDDGGTDTITAGSGDDIVLGGFAGDAIDSGDGSDVVFGDNGLIGYTDAVMTNMVSTDSVGTTGGDDTIDAGDGDNVVIAGVGNDDVVTGGGADVVLGDNGAVTNDASGNLVQALATDPALGGNDTLATGDGNDVVMGGIGNDLVLSDGGNDILFGDNGSVIFSGGVNVLIEAVDPEFGGNDTINGAAGNDILIAGQGDDLLFGSLDEDLLFGGTAAVTLSGGLVTSIESDLNDLVTRAMFDMFDALDDEEEDALALLFSYLPGHAVSLNDLVAAMIRADAVLDTRVFQKMFDLGASGHQGRVIEVTQFQLRFVPGALTLASLRGDVDAQAGDAEAAPALTAAASELPVQPVVQGFAAAAPAAAERGSATLAAMLGAAGLLAVQHRQPRGSGLPEQRTPQRRIALK
jgi:hypothetical protein